MIFENHLTKADVDRAAREEMSPAILTSANLSLLEAIEAFWVDIVDPFIHSHSELPLRQLVIASLSTRLFGYARTVTRLNSLVFQQAVTSAERSVFELWLDLRLVHQSHLPDGPDRLRAFAEFQKLAAARRTDLFFRKNPTLDKTPSAAIHHRTFIEKEAARIDAQTAHLWPTKSGKPPRPQHWTTLTLEERARAVGPQAQLQCIYGYDMRNFTVHGGITSVMNVPNNAVELMFVQSVKNIARCLQDVLQILAVESKITDAIPDYMSIVEYLDVVPSHSAVDAILRGLGEPQRYFFRAGPWSVRDLSGD